MIGPGIAGKLRGLVLGGLAALGAGPLLQGQALPAGIGPGSYVSVGVMASGFNSSYGQQRLIGPSVYVDANLYRRIGVEAEARSLRYRATDGLSETTVLAGPRLSLRPYNFRPYAKFLVGRGRVAFPYGYATGSYFVMAPGGGVDWRLRRGPFQLRVVDFEYQIWPQFTFGPMHPWGVSTGISYRILPRPRG